MTPLEVLVKHWLLLLLVGCAGGSSDDDDPDTSQVFAGAPLAELSDGDCPGMQRSGSKTISSAGFEREFELILPEGAGTRMPLLFVWHGLGDSAGSMASWMALQDFADDHGVVVIVPESRDSFGDTWQFSQGSPDVTLFDDLRTCASDTMDIDLSRVHVTGFSFGGLQTTWLTMTRSDALASSFVMSGGTAPFFLPYSTPEHTLPVMVMWGGSADTYGEGITEVRFEETSMDLSSKLRADGHFVAHCDHGGGHTVPLEIHDILGPWVSRHVYGEPSPLQEEGLGDVPTWCTIP